MPKEVEEIQKLMLVNDIFAVVRVEMKGGYGWLVSYEVESDWDEFICTAELMDEASLALEKKKSRLDRLIEGREKKLKEISADIKKAERVLKDLKKLLK